MSVGGRCVGTHLFAGEGGAEPTASILSRPRTTDTHFESGRDAARPYRGVASTTMTQSSTDGGSNVNVALAIWCCCCMVTPTVPDLVPITVNGRELCVPRRLVRATTGD